MHNHSLKTSLVCAQCGILKLAVVDAPLDIDSIYLQFDFHVFVSNLISLLRRPSSSPAIPCEMRMAKKTKRNETAEALSVLFLLFFAYWLHIQESRGLSTLHLVNRWWSKAAHRCRFHSLFSRIERCARLVEPRQRNPSHKKITNYHLIKLGRRCFIRNEFSMESGRRVNLFFFCSFHRFSAGFCLFFLFHCVVFFLFCASECVWLFGGCLQAHTSSKSSASKWSTSSTAAERRHVQKKSINL